MNLHRNDRAAARGDRRTTRGILRRLRGLVVALLVGATLVPSLAEAREDFCINPTTRQIDSAATTAYRRFAATSNLTVMARLNGTWLSTIVSRPTNQISYLYENFSFVRGVPASGLYSYTNFVCTLQNTFCSRYDGTGVYAVRSNGTNSFFGSKIVSDTVRLNHACLSLGGTFPSANVWVSGGVRHTRCVTRNGRLVC